MVTSKQIQGDIFRALRASELATQITGRIYRDGLRPRDSELEDCEVIHTAGVTNLQFAQGVVVINVYVPDIDPYKNGVMVENMARTEEIESLCADFVAQICNTMPHYKFGLAETIMTHEDRDIFQHFVSIRLTYEIKEN